MLPAVMLLGFRAGIALNPVLLAAMSNVTPDQSGLASGVVNPDFMMGGALGLAVLASLAAARTSSLHAASSPLVALVGGYHVAFLAGAACAAGAASIGGELLRFRALSFIDTAQEDLEPKAA